MKKMVALQGWNGRRQTDRKLCGKRKFSQQFVPRFLETVILKLVSASPAVVILVTRDRTIKFDRPEFNTKNVTLGDSETRSHILQKLLFATAKNAVPIFLVERK
jgi:hypothetical protein